MGLIRSCELFKKLYVTFVRPQLEYGQVVWAPHLHKYVNMFENVQIRATKLVDGLSKLDYQERLKKLDLPTLVYRRARGEMIELFKHFRVYDRATIAPSFQPRNRLSRKHGFQLHQLKSKDGTRGLQTNSFYHRCTSIWNNLPRNVVHAEDINEFKNMLDNHWKTAPMKYDHLFSSDS